MAANTSFKVLRWVQDDDGDIGLQILGLLTLIKYKDHAIARWGGSYRDAPRYVESAFPDDAGEVAPAPVSLVDRLANLPCAVGMHRMAPLPGMTGRSAYDGIECCLNCGETRDV